MLKNINLNLLRSLYALLQEAHVSNAAKRLHITQSAVSRQLAQLRELCNDELLVRNANSLVLTPKAEILKTKLDVFFGDIEHLLSDVSFEPETWTAELVISSSDYVAQYVLPDICSRLNRQAPQLSITYHLWKPEYIGQLHDLGIDIASTMLPEEPKGVSSQCIGSDYLVVVMSRNHLLANKSQLNVEDIVQYSHIKITGGADKDSIVDEQLKRFNYHRHIQLQVPFFTAAVSHLQQTDCLMVMPLHIAENLSKYWPITHKKLPFDVSSNKYWLIWHPKFDHDLSHKWAREQIVSAMQDCDSSIHL
ncbi:LysR family transcriptional regulator [Vibrio viridaestus]|uniref:LysR family transcriptional regulator n=1 Tax=Vibrio viridaestus TaxID=2487322 RepID=A0A3N9TCG5_9VIBR|nr:LysR family transcriptional regulator [Vibrio viridaestus]RQW61185.1 LysR family transcriptional regulator [Vibrio viridaestus]